MIEEKKKFYIILAIVFSAIFFLNLLYSFYFRPGPLVDARAYDNIAWNIVQGYGYRQSPDIPLSEDFAIARVGPGYEFFLAAIYYVFGRHYEIVWLIQALLAALSAFLIFLITREIFRASWHYVLGLTAAFLVGLSPDLITVQSMLMTETLGIFLVIAAVYLFFRYVNPVRSSADNIGRQFSSGGPASRLSPAAQKSYMKTSNGVNVNQPPYSAIFIGLILGLAILVRTPSFFLFFPIATYLLMIKNWKHFLLMGFTILIVLLPWTVRNFKVYGEFIPTNIAGGFNLLVGNHPGASGEQEPYPVLSRYVEESGYVGADKKATKDAKDFILRHPLEFLKITAYRASIYFSFARPTGFWFHLGGLSKTLTLALSSVYSVLIFVSGFWGIFKIKDLRGEEKKNAKLLLAMLIMAPLAVIGVVVETRYRFAAYPFFAVFASFGLREMINKRISWKVALAVAGMLFLNTGFDVFRNLARIIERIHGL